MNQDAYQFIYFPLLHTHDITVLHRYCSAMEKFSGNASEPLQAIQAVLQDEHFVQCHQSIHGALQKILFIAGKESSNDNSSLQPVIAEICSLNIQQLSADKIADVASHTKNPRVKQLLLQIRDQLATDHWQDATRTIYDATDNLQEILADNTDYQNAVTHMDNAFDAIEHMQIILAKLDHSPIKNHAWLVKLKKDSSELFDHFIDDRDKNHIHVKVASVYDLDTILELRHYFEKQIDQKIAPLNELKRSPKDRIITTSTFAHAAEPHQPDISLAKVAALIGAVCVAIAVSLGLKKREPETPVAPVARNPSLRARYNTAQDYYDPHTVNNQHAQWQDRPALRAQNHAIGR